MADKMAPRDIITARRGEGRKVMCLGSFIFFGNKLPLLELTTNTTHNPLPPINIVPLPVAAMKKT
jgi:hypothetical protein